MPTSVLNEASTTSTTTRGLAPGLRLILAGLTALVVIAAYLFFNTQGNLDFALKLRGASLGAMIIAAFAQGVATVIFHTVTGNRILTPSVMGFDALFVLMQTLLVAVLGGAVLAETDGVVRLLLQTVIMVVFATLLYRWLFSSSSGLYLTLLVGVVLGLGFDTISTFLQRLLNPTDYDLLSLELYGRMTSVDVDQLPFAAAATAVVVVIIWRGRHTYDALLLGRELATSVGVNYRRELTISIVCISILISLSTALVGPMTFFGFVIATVAYQISGTNRHSVVLPMAVLLGLILLGAGQFILQHIFYASGFLTVILEFAGGIVFLTLLLIERKR